MKKDTKREKELRLVIVKIIEREGSYRVDQKVDILMSNLRKKRASLLDISLANNEWKLYNDE